MNAPLTRRALLGASAAVGAAALPTVASAMASHLPADDPDAAFVALIAEHAVVVETWTPLDAVAVALLERHAAEAPKRPMEMFFRYSDIHHKIGNCSGRETCPDGTLRAFYNGADIGRLSKAPPIRSLDTVGGSRRQEILAAHAAWMAEQRALTDRLGLPSAIAECDRALDVVEAVEMAIMDHVPVTLDGFRAKARWIAASLQPEQWAEALLRDLCGAEAMA